MKRKLMDILACPVDKHYPLGLIVFQENESQTEVLEGLIVCTKCRRWYPIRDTVPEMLPDNLREEGREVEFLKKWRDQIPKEILETAVPFTLKSN